MRNISDNPLLKSLRPQVERRTEQRRTFWPSVIFQSSEQRKKRGRRSTDY